MDKSLLEMETPKSCFSCMLCRGAWGNHYCIARIYVQHNLDDCKIKDLRKRQKWCPLIRISIDEEDLQEETKGEHDGKEIH